MFQFQKYRIDLSKIPPKIIFKNFSKLFQTNERKSGRKNLIRTAEPKFWPFSGNWILNLSVLDSFFIFRIILGISRIDAFRFGARTGSENSCSTTLDGK